MRALATATGTTMKGIILAGGSGTRLYPMTKIISKQLQPVYDKPMIFYPLSLLMLAGIKDILIISTERDTPFIMQLLGSGSEYGLNLSYKVQKDPNGLPEAFIIGETFIGNDNVTMVLGDNLFHGDINFMKDAVELQERSEDNFKARVFAYPVEDPQRYGVVEFDKNTKEVISLEEKPQNPKSKFAVPGLYIFDKTVSERSKNLTPSARGEIEIVDLIKSYLEEDALGVEPINRGVSWFDTGTAESLLEASSVIHSIEKRQGLKVACLEEIALRKGFLTPEEFKGKLQQIPSSPYKQYLEDVYEDIIEFG